VEATALPGDPFQNRAYGGGGAPHAVATAKSAVVVVTMLGTTKEQLLRQPRGIRFYRLAPGTDSPINVRTLLDQKPKAEVTSDALKRAIENPPRVPEAAHRNAWPEANDKSDARAAEKKPQKI
jgi:hypothetical protein